MKLSTRITIIAVVLWVAGAAIFALDLLPTLVGIIIISFFRPLVFEKFFDMISNEKVFLQSCEYYPFKQLIKKNEKNIFLSEIQNTIMSNLLLNSSDCIKKIDLIKIIWPNDKDIFFNKLDTHLTNLKNYLNSESDFDLKFTSKSGLIKLIFN